MKRLQELKENDKLFKQVLKIAQAESEMAMGVNPTDRSQANVGLLNEGDFDYIEKICVIVDQRLRDCDWLEKTLDNIENKYTRTMGGIRFDDELFKSGRSILENYLKEIE